MGRRNVFVSFRLLHQQRLEPGGSSPFHFSPLSLSIIRARRTRGILSPDYLSDLQVQSLALSPGLPAKLLGRVTSPQLHRPITNSQDQSLWHTTALVQMQATNGRLLRYSAEFVWPACSTYSKQRLSAYDEDAVLSTTLLLSLPTCNGRVGATGMCLGGHLAYRCALDKRISAAICYFATDVHSHSLGAGKQDDSLQRAGDIKGELVMVSQAIASPPASNAVVVRRSLARRTITYHPRDEI